MITSEAGNTPRSVFEDLKWCLDEHPLDAVFLRATSPTVPRYQNTFRQPETSVNYIKFS